MSDAKDKGLKPVYYIYGPDEYLIEDEIRGIRSRALTPGFEAMNLQVFNCRETGAPEAIAAASTLPAFAGRRVVVVKGAEALKAGDEAAFMEYAKNPAPLTCLVLAACTGKPERGSAFMTLLSERGYVTHLLRPEGARLLGWIKGEARGLGKAMSDGAATRLSEVGGSRLRDLKSEIGKIASFIGDKPVIEAADVADAGLDLREETAFKLSDAIISGDVREALRILDRVSGEEPVKVLGAIAWQVRRNRRFSGAGLVRAIFMLREADVAIKTGRMPGHLVLPMLVLDLCSAARNAAPRGRLESPKGASGYLTG